VDPTVVSLLARFVQQDPNSIVVLRRGSEGVLAVVWASHAATEWVSADVVAGWCGACDEVLALGHEVERDLPVPTGIRRASIVILDATHVAVRFRSRGYETLLSQSVHGVFYMRLDEPFFWSAVREEQDKLLQYALEHLRVVDINDVGWRQIASTREEVLGTTPIARWKIAPAEWCDHMRQLYDQKHTFHCLRAPRGDGTWMDIEGEYICTYDDVGRVTGHYGIQRDITINREELVKSRERLELAIVGADLGIWDADFASRGLYCDPRFMARLGYADSDGWCTWEWWASAIHPDDVEEPRRAFNDHIAGREPLMRSEYRLRKADGTWASVLSIGKRAQGQNRVVGVFVDITERKTLQARVAASERMAALGTLAAGVGHEINNPLTYVVLTLEMMERELANGHTAESLLPLIERARYGAQRVGTVVRDLQSLARPPSGDATPVDPVAVIERCLQITDHQIRHRARVIRELVSTPPVRASEDRLVQVVLNLILNAVQALPQGNADAHWIKIATSSADGRVIIEVSDNGVGIAAADLAHIFDAFFTTKAPGEGTGLGLSISRSIVAGLGGEIDVESEPGRGSRFQINLPAATVRPPDTARALPPTTVRRILVIDDEPLLGELVKSVLDGFEVETDTTATAALVRLRDGVTFDRILCDVMMPDVTGMDFYEQVSEEVRSKIVFVTGGTFTERARAFLARVPNRRLLKPFDVSELASALAD
jgi:PAS domain S-box-containing protein